MKKLFVVDACGYIFRSYFAIPAMTNDDGESTNALFGFARSVLKLIADFSVENIVVVFDGPDNSLHREAIYADYKANRKAIPKDLPYQMEWALKFCKLLGVSTLRIPEVEADDTMASVALWAAESGYDTYLCTTDKDMAQVVDDHIFLLNTYKDNLILDAEGVEDLFGVSPGLMCDFLALTGDASDNIPGVTGIGPKTAAALLKQFRSLEEILTNPEKVSGKKKQEVIRNEVEQARLSRRLVELNTKVSFPKEEDFFVMKERDDEGLKAFCRKMGFSRLLKDLHVHEEAQHDEVSVKYALVDDDKSLKALIKMLKKQKSICFDTETTAIHPMNAELVGIGFCYEPGCAWYVPTGGDLGFDKVIEAVKPLFEDESIGFYGHNVKYDYEVMLNNGVKVANLCFDTILASYLLNAHNRQHSLDKLALDVFGKVKIPIEDLIGKGKKAMTMAEVPIEKVCTYCCEDVDYTCRLKEVLAKELNKRQLELLFFDVELPLIIILASMERKGVYVDADHLKSMTKELTEILHHKEEEIFSEVGERFNLNSPKQLGVVLFEKMGINPPKKIATGYSTSAEVLESLEGEYPIVRKILEFRTLDKLRSTYTEALPQQVNQATQRIHCSFNQSVAATGRLSCQNPNLQNIPVRSEVGRHIRGAFKPQKKKWSFLSSDYSQIELRLLAHFSKDPALLEAFKKNVDVHRYTASLVFDVPLEEVTREQRYQAKTVNFGVIYGQQAYRLSQELGISVKAAQSFIDMYFDRYPRVKGYIEESKERVRQEGKAVTLMGRERAIPEIHSKNRMLRQAAERLAVNTPLQGSGADIIKKAMLKVDQRLVQEKKLAYMVLQIHDELILEVPDFELLDLEIIIREEMEGVVKLKVPLVVDVEIGKNWEEC